MKNLGSRSDGRELDQIRPVVVDLDYITYPEGSVLFSMGDTRVLCNVSIETGVPAWMREGGKEGGWITAEYAMLPRSTHRRTSRETIRPRGRTQEISRLVWRSLRAAANLERLPAVTCTVDCDVFQADGGTRSAAVTGGYLALSLALRSSERTKENWTSYLSQPVAAISVGKVGGRMMVDLDYSEDSKAEADINLVMNAAGEYIEIQGSSEQGTFDKAELSSALDLGERAIRELLELQDRLVSKWVPGKRGE